jgi:hypothetical protein
MNGIYPPTSLICDQALIVPKFTTEVQKYGGKQKKGTLQAGTDE